MLDERSLECTLRDAGVSAEDQRKTVLMVCSERGGVATIADIVEVFDAYLAPRTLSAQGRASLRTVVNREMAWAGLVTQAHGFDAPVIDGGSAASVFAWAITEKGRALLGEPASTPPSGGGGGGRRVVRVVRSAPQPAPKRVADTREEIALRAAAHARRFFRSGRHGALMAHVDADDAAQEAALRALLRAPSFDPERGNVGQFASVVARSTLKDLRRSAVSRRHDAFVGGDVYDVLADGADTAASTHEALTQAAFAPPRWDDCIDGQRALARVVKVVKPRERRALKRWVAGGADGPQGKRANEVRLKDALCSARTAARKLGLMGEAVAA